MGISATNTATLNGVGDAKDAASGAGVAIVSLTQHTVAAIDSTDPTGTSAGSLSVLASQQSTVTAQAKAGKGGATHNNKPANGSDRGNGQSSTSDGAIDVAGAIAVAILSDTTRAYVSGATVTTAGAQAVTANAKNTVIATGDGGTADGSGGSSGFGLAIGGVGVIIANLITEAYVLNAILSATAA